VPVTPFQLTTDRLLLRPPSPEDRDDIAGYANDLQWLRYLTPLPHPFDEAALETYVQRHLPSAWADTEAHLAVELDGHNIGMVSLINLHEANRTAELGYNIAPAHWNHGFATEAVTALINHCVGPLNLQRLTAQIDTTNTPSIHLVDKLNMTRDPTPPATRLARDGTPVTYATYTLLREDWPATD
jgi:RimJ/RimL family protein N-acetyltransferase